MHKVIGIFSTSQCAIQTIARTSYSFWCFAFLILFCCFSAPMLLAEEADMNEDAEKVMPFSFSDIQIKGTNRIDNRQIFSNLTIEPNQETTQDDLVKSAEKLFATGLFDDIQFSLDEDVLIITIKERPLIENVEIKGNKLIETKKLKTALADVNLKEGVIFKRAVLDKVIDQLRSEYNLAGRYGTQVKAEVKKQANETVAVDLNIQETDVISIGDINIIGNKQISEQKLLEQMQLKKSADTSWYSSNNRYSKERLSGDLERITSYYLDRGFINFSIESAQVSITPDKSQIYITIHVNEGNTYKIKKIDFIGDLTLPESTLRAQLNIKTEDIYAQKQILASQNNIEDKLAEIGYSQAKIQFIHKINPEDHTVDLRFSINPGQRVYVRRINFKGNLRTDDSVLRRELLQLEGAPYSTKQIQQSKARLERLGFFNSIKVETLPVQGKQDQVDLSFEVEEQFFGSISGGLQYSNFSGTSITFGYSEKNIFGSGKDASIDLNLGGIRQNLDFSLLDRYFTLDGVSLDYRLFFSKTNYDKASLSNFNTDEYGGGLNMAYPISENGSINFGTSYEITDLKLGTDPIKEIQQFTVDNGKHYQEFGLTTGYSFNNLDRAILPTKGSKRSLSALISTPASDLKYYRLLLTERDYFPLDKENEWILMLRGNLGYAQPYGENQYIPFFKNFYAGGLNTLRGYSNNSMGTRGTNQDGSKGSRLGGNILVSSSVDLILPLTSFIKQKNFRLSLFLETANVFTTHCIIQSNFCKEGIDLNDLRYTSGLTLTWFSPVGPMALSLGSALNRKDEDDTETIQFVLGGSL